MSKRTLIGLLAMVFFIHYNTYFGWSIAQEYYGEIICDGIFFTMICLFILTKKKGKK